MQASLLLELRQRRFSIRTRWEALLRTEPVTSPLALPDALVHLIDTTLEEILTALDGSSGDTSPSPENLRAPLPCVCGRNPYLAYFTAGKQAMLEGLVLAQAACAPLEPSQRDASLEELNRVLFRLNAREVDAFCGVCQFRHLSLTSAEPTLVLCR